MLFSEPTAPAVRPCVVGSAAFEIRLWIDAETAKPSTFAKITA